MRGSTVWSIASQKRSLRNTPGLMVEAGWVVSTGMHEKETPPLTPITHAPAHEVVGLLHALPGNLAGKRPLHLDADKVAGLDLGLAEADGVLAQNLLAQRHGAGLAEDLRGKRGGG